MATISGLNINVTANTNDFTAKMRASATAAEQLRRSVARSQGAISFDSARKSLNRFGRELDRVGGAATRLLGRMTALAGGISAIAAVTSSFRLAAQFETASIAMAAMIGNAKDAADLMNNLRDFSTSTPFGFSELLPAAQKLVAYGFSAKEVMGSMKMLGDVASGTGQSLGDIAYLYGTIRTQGRALTVDIRQFANRGIPIYESLAKVLQTDTAGVQKLVTEGRVGFPAIQAAFMQMTGAGGKFHDMTAQIADSLGGAFDKLKGQTSIALSDIGESAAHVLQLQGRLTSLGQTIRGMVPQIQLTIRSMLEWASAHRETLISMVKLTAGIGAVAIVVPRVIGVFDSLYRVSVLCDKALDLIAYHPLLTAGVAALGLFAAVAIRSATANETWAESAYHISRSMGLLNLAVSQMSFTSSLFGVDEDTLKQLPLADAVKKLADLKGQIQDQQTNLSGDTDLRDRVADNQKLINLLESQRDTVREIIAEQKNAETDLGYGPRTLAQANDGLAAARKAGEAMQKQADAQRAASLASPPLTGPLLETPANDAAKKMAEDVQGLTDSLVTQARTLGMTAHQVDIYKLGLSDLDPMKMFLVTLADVVDGTKKTREGFETAQKGIANLRQQVSSVRL